MSLLMDTPNSADLVNIDELVSISMNDTTVVVRPTKRPGALGTQVVVDVVNAATTAGSAVMLHSPEGLTDVCPDIDVPACSGDDGTEPVAVAAAGVGLVQVRTEGRVWTIDFGAARFVRTEHAIDRLFLAASDWTDFVAIWIGPRFVRARMADGSFVAGRRALQPAKARTMVGGRSGTESLAHIA